MICKVKANLNASNTEEKMFFDFFRNINNDANDFLLINMWKNNSEKIDIVFEIKDYKKSENTLDIAKNLELNYNGNGSANVIVSFSGTNINRVYKNGERIK
ncbi:hypothetical protein [Spiroplasma endosymbiont of Amphibalanus improvisus]|uniref:hypothetical protein n=1 Tax=Spiroplasma endosymbiont of Amphibalanus improvisus TaxID=3066327 RepID=UPI00313BFF57